MQSFAGRCELALPMLQPTENYVTVLLQKSPKMFALGQEYVCKY